MQRTRTENLDMPRKLVLSMQLSLDGFVGTTDGSVDWIFPQFDEDFTRSQVEKLQGAGAHLMGRVLYESMSTHWPKSKEPFAPPMNQKPKIVFSKSLEKAKWGPVTIERGDLAEAIARLKGEDGGYLLAHGGASFARSLSRLGLVDEYRLVVHPVTLGDGLRIFDAPLKLRLTKLATFPSGAVELTYSRNERAASV